MLVFVFSLLLSPPAAATPSCSGPQAVLVSGHTNSCEFLEDLDRGAYLLKPAFPCQQILEGTGAGDLAYSLPELCGAGTPGQRELGLPPSAPTLRNGRLPVNGPGTADALRTSVAAAARDLREGEPFTLYFTDHGGSDEKGTFADLEGGEKLRAADLRATLAKLPAASPVTLIQEQCFSGGMLAALFDPATGRPRPRSCGVAAADANELSFNGETFSLLATHLKSDPAAAARADLDGDGKISLAELALYRRSRNTGTSSRDEEIRSATVLSSSYFLDLYQKLSLIHI